MAIQTLEELTRAIHQLPREQKITLWKMLDADHPIEARKLESKSIWYLGQGTDAYEAAKAWTEKRKLDFSRKPSLDMPPSYPWWYPRSFD